VGYYFDMLWELCIVTDRSSEMTTMILNVGDSDTISQIQSLRFDVQRGQRG